MSKTIAVAIVLAVTIPWCRDASAQPFPSDLGVLLNAAGCLDVRGGVAAAGTPIQSYECNGTAAQAWSSSVYGLTSFLASQSFITSQNSNAVLTRTPPTENWELRGEHITNPNGNACMNAPNMQSGVQLVRGSCSVPTAWIAKPIVAKLHGDLQPAVADVPPAFMNARAQMVATVKNGLLYQNNTVFTSTKPQSLLPPTTTSTNCTILFTSPPNWAAWNTTYYVVTTKGVIYLVNACGKDPILPGKQDPMQLGSSKNQINHAALAYDTEVLAAGEIDVVNGKIVYIDNCSGHYTPTQYSLLFVINWLSGKGAQGLPTHGLRLAQLNQMVHGQGIGPRIRAGTGNCFSYVPPGN